MARQRTVSTEEKQFVAWLGEAIEHGLIDRYGDQPFFPLVEKQRTDKRHVCAAHHYTGDFTLVLTPLGESVFRGLFEKSNVLGFPKSIQYVDTKGGFQKHGGGRSFSINQKLVMYKYGVWVAKVVPFTPAKGVTAERSKAEPAKGWFMKTWCPDACRWTPPNRKPAIGITANGAAGCRTVQEFMARIPPKQIELIKAEEEPF